MILLDVTTSGSTNCSTTADEDNLTVVTLPVDGAGPSPQCLPVLKADHVARFLHKTSCPLSVTPEDNRQQREAVAELPDLGQDCPELLRLWIFGEFLAPSPTDLVKNNRQVIPNGRRLHSVCHGTVVTNWRTKDPRLSFTQTGDQPDLDPSSSPALVISYVVLTLELLIDKILSVNAASVVLTVKILSVKDSLV
ncbi:hypothetical protein J6590_044391 [Homalodisca vitripennis]|nr:hypothetical protein J6590_044391 [Homalodisca vitripennis]